MSDRASLRVAGAEHQELQVPAVADAAQLPKPAAPAADGHAAPEPPDGALVPHALPHAPGVRVAPRVQGLVREPAHRHDRGQQGVQREPDPSPAQGQLMQGGAGGRRGGAGGCRGAQGLGAMSADGWVGAGARRGSSMCSKAMGVL